jgi:hypothetical protein
MDNRDFIHQALKALYPTIMPNLHYLWVMQYDWTDPNNPVPTEPAMVKWDEARLGPLDMAKIDAKCAELAAAAAAPKP